MGQDRACPSNFFFGETTGACTEREPQCVSPHVNLQLEGRPLCRPMISGVEAAVLSRSPSRTGIFAREDTRPYNFFLDVVATAL